MINNNKELNIETSKALQDLFFLYTHLPIGGQEIPCPYWVNKIKLGVFGHLGGKGTPEQIVSVTKKEAERAGLDLEKMTKEEILRFMKQKRIGIDCSGFVFWMLDVLDREKGGDGIADDIPRSKGRFLEARASVKMLADEKVSILVKVVDICIGDIIRLRGGKHMTIVTALEKDKAGSIKKIVYAHSSSKTKTSGVHAGIIDIISSGDLQDQKWLEETDRGENYGKKCYLPEMGDGIRRLRIWQ